MIEKLTTILLFLLFPFSSMVFASDHPFELLEESFESDKCDTAYNNVVSNLGLYRNHPKKLQELLKGNCLLTKGVGLYFLAANGRPDSMQLIRKQLKNKSETFLNCIVIDPLANSKTEGSIELIIESIRNEYIHRGCVNDALIVLASTEVESAINFLIDYINTPENNFFDKYTILEIFSKSSNPKTLKALEEVANSKDQQLSDLAKKLINKNKDT